MVFDGVGDVVRVVVLGGLAYAVLVLAIRLAGKRTLSTLNAFDFVVTVAIGSTLATILLSSEVSLAEGAAAIALLVGAQFVVALTSTRWRAARRAVKSGPALLLVDGRMRGHELRRERVTEGEVRQAVRAAGIGDLDRVAAVVLETDGTFSVVGREQVGTGSALVDLGPVDERSRR